MNVKWSVELEDHEREQLLKLTRGGNTQARRMKRAQILLLADRGLGELEIVKALPTRTSTAFRTKKKYVEGGLEYALSESGLRGGSSMGA